MSIMDSYQRKAGITTKMLNSLKHVSCNPVTGSLYAFPKVILPQKAVEEAKVRRSSSKPIDLFFVNWYGGHIEFIRFKASKGIPRELSPSIYSCFSGAKRELHCIFLGKNAIIITAKQGTTIFFSHYNLFLGNLKENWSEKRTQILRVNTGHPIILLKSQKYNMAAVSVKRFMESLGSVHAILDSVSSIAKTATALDQNK